MNRDQVIRAIAAKVAIDLIKENLDEMRMYLLPDLTEGDRVTGEWQGLRLGSVTKSTGRRSAVVVDEAAFLAYVREAYPTEVVETVRPGFRAKILDEMHRSGCDESTGVVVPGVEPRQAEPYLTIRPTHEGRLWVAEQLGPMRRALAGGPDAN